MLRVAEETVQFVSALLAAGRRRRRTRAGRRALGCYRQAVLVLRWFLDGTRLAQLVADNEIGSSTAYRYLHEGIDRCSVAGPTVRADRPERRMDLSWSGKHAAHGGNGQVIAVLDGLADRGDEDNGRR